MHYSWGPVVRWRASRSSHVVTWCNLVTISCAGQNIRNGGQDRLSRSPAMPSDICRDNWNISSIHLPLCETGRLRGRVGFRSSFFLSRYFFFRLLCSVENRRCIRERRSIRADMQFRGNENKKYIGFYLKRGLKWIYNECRMNYKFISVMKRKF